MADSDNNGEERSKDGRFGKGNPGKPKGAVTKVSIKVRESIVNFLENNVDAIQDSFDKLKPKEKLEFVSSILSYAVPKLSSTQIEGEVNAGITIRYEKPGDYIYPSQDQGNTGIPESI